jgi:hypothetical protein
MTRVIDLLFPEHVSCAGGCGSEVTPADGLILEEKPLCGLCAGIRTLEILSDPVAAPALAAEADRALAILRAQLFARRAG